MSDPPHDPRRSIPRVDVLAATIAEEHSGPLPLPLARKAARAVTDDIRSSGEQPQTDRLLANASSLARSWEAPREVLNATGVLLHTNLGRAPMMSPARAPLRNESLEIDLVTGGRGDRQRHLAATLEELTGAETAMVVNNNAAAVLLAVSALAGGREVVVSRGQLVEIGGGFTLPEVVQQGGATLCEVGSTNRTSLRDYEEAIGRETGALLWVHPSNYRVEGFTTSVPIRDLAGLARQAGVPLICDLGSGLLDKRCAWLKRGPPSWLSEEPAAVQSIADGADVVTFSGDKLLGGPQAGVICGNTDAVEALRTHPLARAMRYDRMSSSVLYEVLTHYLNGLASSIPFWAAVEVEVSELKEFGKVVLSKLPETIPASIEPASATVGGGSAPGTDIADVAILIDGADSAERIAANLRNGEIAVIPQVRGDKVVLQLRSMCTAQPETVAALVTEAYFTS